MANVILKDSFGKDKIYSGITTIVLPTTDGKGATFVEAEAMPNYVTGNYLRAKLEASKWDGSNYIISTDLYGELNYDLQLSIPPLLNSPINAKTIIEHALTITQVTNYYLKDELSTYDHSEIVISALNPPPIDLTVAIWGIENGGGNIL